MPLLVSGKRAEKVAGRQQLLPYFPGCWENARAVGQRGLWRLPLQAPPLYSDPVSSDISPPGGLITGGVGSRKPGCPVPTPNPSSQGSSWWAGAESREEAQISGELLVCKSF